MTRQAAIKRTTMMLNILSKRDRFDTYAAKVDFIIQCEVYFP